jgi:MFS family permease
MIGHASVRRLSKQQKNRFATETALKNETQNARYALAVLLGVNLMNFFDRQILGALAEPVRIEFALSDTALGVLNTAFVLIYAVVGIPLGRLTDRWLRTRVIAIGVSVWSLFTAASGIAGSYWTFFATRIGVGIGEASCAPAGQSLIADLYPPHRRARAMGIFMLGLPLGLFAAYLFSGAIGERWGWRVAFYAACVPGLILAGLTLFIKEPVRGAFDAPSPQRTAHAPFSALLRIRTLWWLALSGVLFHFNTYAVNAFQSAFLQRFHGIGLAQANAISSVSLGLAGIIGLLGGGWLGDLWHERRHNGRLLLAGICLLLAAPCVFAALQQPKGSVTMFGLCMGLSSALTFAYYSTVYSAIQDVVPPQLRGTAVSLYFLGMYVLGGAFGTTALGALSDYFAHRVMLDAGATQMLPLFKAAGLHMAMYVMPALMILCSATLFMAARSVPARNTSAVP